eukprot:6473054-Amphidinium_carterae.2
MGRLVIPVYGVPCGSTGRTCKLHKPQYPSKGLKQMHWVFGLRSQLPCPCPFPPSAGPLFVAPFRPCFFPAVWLLDPLGFLGPPLSNGSSPIGAVSSCSPDLVQ